MFLISKHNSRPAVCLYNLGHKKNPREILVMEWSLVKFGSWNGLSWNYGHGMVSVLELKWAPHPNITQSLVVLFLFSVLPVLEILPRLQLPQYSQNDKLLMFYNSFIVNQTVTCM